MKRAIISLFVGLAVLVTSCSKSVTTSSSKPERIAAPTPGPEPTEVLARDDETPPVESVPFESAPTIIKRGHLRYPEIARKAGLEGTVWVKIWVGKTGKPRKVVIQKSASEIFDQAAIEAAMQYLFTPALINGKPVEVWVSIPFNFRLK